MTIKLLMFSLLGIVAFVYVYSEVKEYRGRKKLLDKQLGPEQKE